MGLGQKNPGAEPRVSLKQRRTVKIQDGTGPKENNRGANSSLLLDPESFDAVFWMRLRIYPRLTYVMG